MRVHGEGRRLDSRWALSSPFSHTQLLQLPALSMADAGTYTCIYGIQQSSREIPCKESNPIWVTVTVQMSFWLQELVVAVSFFTIISIIFLISNCCWHNEDHLPPPRCSLDTLHLTKEAVALRRSAPGHEEMSKYRFFSQSVEQTTDDIPNPHEGTQVKQNRRLCKVTSMNLGTMENQIRTSDPSWEEQPCLHKMMSKSHFSCSFGWPSLDISAYPADETPTLFSPEQGDSSLVSVTSSDSGNGCMGLGGYRVPALKRRISIGFVADCVKQPIFLFLQNLEPGTKIHRQFLINTKLLHFCRSLKSPSM
ncbi:uncharacterized protein LOC115643774 isoform X1 [Gopherus evgoodei]|uniref:uncharacterized protein LOC115643774 isoform X1 n=1 Tax=Gopherus evgoodei TaxID=1825980 RepID=UPI0011D013BC|nr:uncharacterized protein LOC115643774 isoform X1 [Gopherus evgoodei]